MGHPNGLIYEACDKSSVSYGSYVHNIFNIRTLLIAPAHPVSRAPRSHRRCRQSMSRETEIFNSSNMCLAIWTD